MASYMVYFGLQYEGDDENVDVDGIEEPVKVDII